MKTEESQTLEPGQSATRHEPVAEEPSADAGSIDYKTTTAPVLTIPHLQGRAAANLRRHIVRGSVRVLTLGFFDLVTLFLCWQLLRWFGGADWMPAGLHAVLTEDFVGAQLGGWKFIIALLLGLGVTRNYGMGDRRHDAGRIFAATALAGALALWQHLGVVPFSTVLERFAVIMAVFGPALVANRSVLHVLIRRYVPNPRTSARTILVGPAGECIEMRGREAFANNDEYNVLGFVDIANPASRYALGTLDEFDRILHENRIESVILCGHIPEKVFTNVLEKAILAECETLWVSRTFEFAGAEPEVVWRHGQPFIGLRAIALRGQQFILKRLLDIVGSSFALLVLSPVMAIIAIAIRLDSPGPALFGHSRLGRHGRKFRCLKFRSMHVDAERRLREDPALYEQYVSNDYKLPVEQDTRITRVGRFLRRTSLDELPQLWNVLKGDMSLVGPRPIVPEEIHHYNGEGPLLLSLKPGITGAWQVNGRSTIAYPERAVLELEYVHNWSLMNDIRILLRTLPAVFSGRGAH